MQDPNIQGISGEYIIPLKAYIDKTFSAEQRTVIYERLSPDVRATLTGELHRSEIYPTPCATELFHGIAHVVGDPQQTKDHIIAYGRSLADEATNSFMKLLFKILTPRLLTSKFPAIYARYHKGGTLRTDVTHIDDNRIAFTTEGYDYLHFMATGWILYVYERLGKKNIQVKTNVPLGEANIPEMMRWDVTWE